MEHDDKFDIFGDIAGKLGMGSYSKSTKYMAISSGSFCMKDVLTMSNAV